MVVQRNNYKKKIKESNCNKQSKYQKTMIIYIIALVQRNLNKHNEKIKLCVFLWVLVANVDIMGM